MTTSPLFFSPASSFIFKILDLYRQLVAGLPLHAVGVTCHHHPLEVNGLGPAVFCLLRPRHQPFISQKNNVWVHNGKIECLAVVKGHDGGRGIDKESIAGEKRLKNIVTIQTFHILWIFTYLQPFLFGKVEQLVR